MLYKDSCTLDTRVSESNKILAKYPSHIPVIVDADSKLKLKKNKFLVPKDVSVGHLLCSIRKQMTVTQTDAVFLFVDKTLLSSTKLMSDIYEDHTKSRKNNDKFLYIYMSKENTFGQ